MKRIAVQKNHDNQHSHANDTVDDLDHSSSTRRVETADGVHYPRQFTTCLQGPGKGQAEVIAGQGTPALELLPLLPRIVDCRKVAVISGGNIDGSVLIDLLLQQRHPVVA